MDYKKKQAIINKIQKKYGIDSVYNHRNDKDFDIYINKVNYYTKYDNRVSEDGGLQFMEAMFNQHFAGCTDYVDHRNDTKQQLIELVNNAKDYTQSLQIIHFIDYDTEDLCYNVELSGYMGGRSAKFTK